jgi:antibiotic biosynthesis monooxygenase (ABM) superfamily enzyme
VIVLHWCYVLDFSLRTRHDHGMCTTISTHQPSAPVSQHRQAVTVWLAVLPTLTLLQLLLGDILAAVPPYLRPPIIATLAVPIVVYAVMPRLARLTARVARR